MKLNELKDKKTLILGFGREGRDSFLFLRKLFPKKILGVADRLELEKLSPKAKKLIYHISHDRRKYSIKLHLGENYLKAIKNYDVIIKSPGIPPKILASQKFRRASRPKITSQTEIFFENCPGKIVGITGTKGKSTTASLIYKILKEGGFRDHLVGNIGKPVLSLLFSAIPKDIYVYELSSYQLQNLKKSPQIAVFLNIYPEHLDYHQNFKEYIRAKQNIARYQTSQDYFIFNRRDKRIREIAQISHAKKIPIDVPSVDFYDTCRKSQLKGEFNFLNLAAAIEVGKIFKIPKEKIKKAIKEFKPLPHRLEYVGTFKGITFYNDALSTIPETTIAAIEALGNRVQTIILGGLDRGLDFKKLAKRVLKSKIKNVILFPTTGEKIWQSIRQAQDKALQQKHLVVSHIEPFFVNNMLEAVKIAYQYTKKGGICLLSCASPSFSLFRDYRERGNLFKKYVKKLAKK